MGQKRAASSERITSVLQLAKHKVGEKLYAIFLRPLALRNDVPSDWAQADLVHPKTIIERGFAKGAWPLRRKLPKLHSADFNTVLDLLTTMPLVEVFEVKQVMRSCDTGEFCYVNSDDEWMPESNLFSDHQSAVRERTRIMGMIRRWADDGCGCEQEE